MYSCALSSKYSLAFLPTYYIRCIKVHIHYSLYLGTLNKFHYFTQLIQCNNMKSKWVEHAFFKPLITTFWFITEDLVFSFMLLYYVTNFCEIWFLGALSVLISFLCLVSRFVVFTVLLALKALVSSFILSLWISVWMSMCDMFILILRLPSSGHVYFFRGMFWIEISS